MPPTSCAQLLRLFRDLGIGPNDAVLVHSSLRAIGPVEGGADGIIDTLIRATDPDGLLAVPTHTWATVNDQQPVFDQLRTPSHVGALTNILRGRSGALRSLHPTHSVAAIGRRAAEFVAGHELDSSPCSPRSPYAKLIDYAGRILMLGVDLTSCTFIHCLEEIAGLGEIWSLSDPRPRTLIRADGATIGVLARGHKDYKSDNYGRAEGDFLAAGFLRKRLLNGAPVLVLDAAPCAAYLVPRFRRDPHYFW